MEDCGILWDYVLGCLEDLWAFMEVEYSQNKQQSTGLGFGDYDELETFGNNMTICFLICNKCL